MENATEKAKVIFRMRMGSIGLSGADGHKQAERFIVPAFQAGREDGNHALIILKAKRNLFGSKRFGQAL